MKKVEMFNRTGEEMLLEDEEGHRHSVKWNFYSNGESM